MLYMETFIKITFLKSKEDFSFFKLRFVLLLPYAGIYFNYIKVIRQNKVVCNELCALINYYTLSILFFVNETLLFTRRLFCTVCV